MREVLQRLELGAQLDLVVGAQLDVHERLRHALLDVVSHRRHRRKRRARDLALSDLRVVEELHVVRAERRAERVAPHLDDPRAAHLVEKGRERPDAVAGLHHEAELGAQS